MPTPRRYATPAARQAAYRQRQAEARSKEAEAKAMALRPAVPTSPGARRWETLIRQAGGLLETVQQEMQEYHDQRSDRWQESERGEVFLERVQALQEVQSAVEDLTP
jgi:hypothetical protein